MHTPLCDRLGIELPIFAFTHCRDVVAAVSKAGGFGVLGAVGFPPDQLEVELKWIDEHVGDKPYGVDIVIPGKYEGKGEVDPVKLEQMLLASVPEQHRRFADKILADHGVPKLPEGDRPVGALLGWTAATATPQVEVALKHPKVRLIANALGTPPAEIIDEIHASGRLVAALCGAGKQALAHKAAGVDIIIAQGTEGGGHTGDIGSMVLWPEVVEAVAPTPVLAAGGVGTGADRRRARDGCAGVDGLSARRERGRRAAGADRVARRPRAGHGPLALVDRQPAACCGTTGPTRGRGRIRPGRSACRSSSWSPGTQSRAAIATPTRRRP
jgi:NAD(P)H-dependent flavin oxidoreductase YrpB (nitropropane dioxygenase family)